MADLYLEWQTDLAWSPSLALQLASGSLEGQQRVIRRLLTNPGDYFTQPTYGAGLPEKVGSLATPAEVEAIVLSQMLLETAVSQDPAPVVTVAQIVNGVSIIVQYTDAQTGDPVYLGFDVNS